MAFPRIYADFQNADPRGRLRLTCYGTLRDLCRQRIKLQERAVFTFYAAGEHDELLETEGDVTYVPAGSEAAIGHWVANIEWDAIRYVKTDPSESPGEHPCFVCRTDLREYFAGNDRDGESRCPCCGSSVMEPLAPLLSRADRYE